MGFFSSNAPTTANTTHAVNGTLLLGPYPEQAVIAQFGMGCFWGAERIFWELPGVISTSVGYAGGETSNPTYEAVCSGRTGHAEVVQVVYDLTEISYEQLLKTFFEAHDPTQYQRQGNDRGSQYRSVIFADDHQFPIAQAVAETYNQELHRHGRGTVTTEIVPPATYTFAEDYHQQYLYKVPHGYCGLQSTGVSCPVAPATTM